MVMMMMTIMKCNKTMKLMYFKRALDIFGFMKIILMTVKHAVIFVAAF